MNVAAFQRFWDNWVATHKTPRNSSSEVIAIEINELIKKLLSEELTASDLFRLVAERDFAHQTLQGIEHRLLVYKIALLSACNHLSSLSTKTSAELQRQHLSEAERVVLEVLQGVEHPPDDATVTDLASQQPVGASPKAED